jgi:hypothetical protein
VGEVRARLRCLRDTRNPLLTLMVPGLDGPAEFAVCSRTVAGFLRDTTDIVPQGAESQFVDVDDAIAEILGEAA